MIIERNPGSRQLVPRIVAATLAGLGLYMIAFGDSWGPVVLGLLPDSASGGWLELIVPFLPMLPLSAAALAASSHPRWINNGLVKAGRGLKGSLNRDLHN